MNIPRPCILVCGGMQPDLLHTLAADNRAENGFLSRLCAVYPDHTEKGSYNNAILPDKIKTDWEEFLAALTNMRTSSTISLSREAQQQYAGWFDQNVKKTNEESSGYLKGVYGKLDIISLRLAIIIRGMNMVCEGEFSAEITGEEMETAVALTEYFRATALKVYKRIFDNSDLQGIDKKLIANYLFKELGANKSEIAKVLKTSRSQIDRVLEG